MRCFVPDTSDAQHQRHCHQQVGPDPVVPAAGQSARQEGQTEGPDGYHGKARRGPASKGTSPFVTSEMILSDIKIY